MSSIIVADVNTAVQQRRLRISISLALGFGTLLLYIPAIHHSFVEYDDQQYVFENPMISGGLTLHGLAWAFGFHAANWHPVAWLSHMLDCQIYGLNAGGHHLTSAIIHAASTWLLFLFLNRATGAIWRSAAVAAIFAWHPLHVESVAWVAERKDVLCAFFWMLTLNSYLSYARRPGAARYCATLALFALCLMSKPMGVTLPFVLLLLDYWPLKRISNGEFRVTNAEKKERTAMLPASWWRLIVEKVPFFVLSGGACVLTVLAQRQAIVTTKGLPFSERFEHTMQAYLHYLEDAFCPHGLAIYYPYEAAIPISLLLLACVVLIGITLLSLKTAPRWPYVVVGWFWFVGTLVPVIGLVQVGDQAWADRYMYLPLVGLSITVVWLMAEEIRSPLLLRLISAAAALAMLVTTSVQLGYWKNTRTVFEHAAKVTPNNYLAITMLGSLLAKDGKLDEAVDQYHLALKYMPNFPEAYFYLGNAFDQQGKLDEAVACYRKSLAYTPAASQIHIFLGIALAKESHYQEAEAEYLAALKLDPDAAAAHNNLARLLHTEGRLDEAVEHYKAALALDPNLAIAHNNLGILLLQKGDLAEGTHQLREAIRLKPDDGESLYNLALALNQQQQWSEAAELFAKTVGPQSTDPKARTEYATALAHLRRTREAASQYGAAIVLNEDFPDALSGLSWILATVTNSDLRNGEQAVALAQKACQLTGQKDPEKLKTLSAAYAEAGKYSEAAQTALTAKTLAESANRHELAAECQRMSDQFKSFKPWRE